MKIKYCHHPNSMFQRAFYFCSYIFLLLPRVIKWLLRQKHVRDNAFAQVTKFMHYYFKLYHYLATTLSPQSKQIVFHFTPRKTTTKRSTKNEKRNFLLTNSTFGPSPSNIL